MIKQHLSFDELALQCKSQRAKINSGIEALRDNGAHVPPRVVREYCDYVNEQKRLRETPEDTK